MKPLVICLLLCFLLSGCSHEPSPRLQSAIPKNAVRNESHQSKPHDAPSGNPSVPTPPAPSISPNQPTKVNQLDTSPSAYLRIVETQVRKATETIQQIPPIETQLPNGTKEEFEELSGIYAQAATDLSNLASETRGLQHPSGSERLHSSIVDWMNELASHCESSAAQCKSGVKPSALRISGAFQTELELYRKANSL